MLERAKQKFEFPVGWGIDLQSEHERYLTEKHVGRPVVVMNYPKEIKAFYMRLNDDGKTVAAMDVLAPGIGEIIGGSQREERLDVLDARMAERGLDKEDYWWYRDLRRYGTVPHAGFGLGFERAIDYVTGLANIRDVIPLPARAGQRALLRPARFNSARSCLNVSLEGGTRMRRRTLLGFLPLGGAALLWRELTSLWRPVANNHVAQTIAAVADVMFPGEGLPSASALGLPDRVLDLFSAAPELEALITKGVDFLDARAAVQGASNFIALEDSRRLAAVGLLRLHRATVSSSSLSLRSDFIWAPPITPSPQSRPSFPYAGPPQPSGFADFQDKPL